MKDTDHNKNTRKKISDLFVTEDEYLESKRAQAEELLKDAKNGKKCREDEEKVDGKCKKKKRKKYVAYARGIGYGIAIPDPLNNPDGDSDSGSNNGGDSGSDSGGTNGGSSGNGGGNGGGSGGAGGASGAGGGGAA